MEYNQLEGRDLATDFLDPSLSGMIHLNGPQALAFTRNRYIGTDFGRTERQRKVLTAVFQKLPATVLTNSGELTDGLFPNLTTNLQQSECYSLSLNAWKFMSYDMVQQCVPVEGTYSDATIREMAVLQVDFDANKQFLKSTIYGE
jgi:anionic cell wall polymer biosynthesis LytR-Cps2A-Psr (LCP) family protein